MCSVNRTKRAGPGSATVASPCSRSSSSAPSRVTKAVRSTQPFVPQTVSPVRPLACAPTAGTAAAISAPRTARRRQRRGRLDMPLLHRRAPAGSLPVQDLLAALEREGAVHAHAGGVLARPAVDRAVAVVGPHEVPPCAGGDARRAVAGVDEVVARPAGEDVALAAVVVVGVPVAPQD